MGQRKTVLNIPASAAFSITASGDTVTSAQALSAALGHQSAPDGVPFNQGLAVNAQDVLLVLVNVLTDAATSIQFFIDTLGVDGVWYAIANSTALVGSAQQWVKTLAGDNSSSSEFGQTVRLRWVLVGAGAVVFSASIFGK